MTKNIPEPPYVGGCACGGVRYSVNAAPMTLYACHCTECQRQSGTAINMSMVIASAAFEITKGVPKQTERSSESGRKVFGYFCPDCGVRLFQKSERSDAFLILRPGTLDDTGWLDPVAMVWTRSAQPWSIIPESLKTYETQPEDFKELLNLWAEG